MKPQELNLLSYEYVIENGTYFDGDIICWSGKYGDQVYNNPMKKNGTPFNGLLYEQYENGQIAYYSFYENGIGQGISIQFYLSGAIKSYCIKNRGVIVGKYYEWYENGDIKKETDHYKNDHHYKFTEYDENGNVTRKGEV